MSDYKRDLVITTKEPFEREPIGIRRYDKNNILLSYAGVKFAISKTEIIDAINELNDFYKKEDEESVEKTELKLVETTGDMNVSFDDDEDQR